MTTVHTLDGGEPYAVTVHPNASVRAWAEDESVFAVEFSHRFRSPVTVILPLHAAVSTASALVSALMTSETAARDDSEAGAGIGSPPASESTTAPQQEGGGVTDDSGDQSS